MELKKVLFLDIDGVINSIRSAVAFGGYPWNVDEESIKLFDHVAIALIRQVCQATGTHIVLSSTWRMTVPFDKLGQRLELPIVSRTPVKASSLSASRGEEIALWLSQNSVEIFAIVDDDADMLEHQLPFFVKTCPYEGFTWKNFVQLSKLLGYAKYAEA